MRQKMMSKAGIVFIVSMLMLSPLVVAQGIEDIISVAKDIGVFQFYLPFILVFAILYGLLIRSKLFGDMRGINIIIALAVSGFIMVYTPVGIAFSQFLTNFAGNVMIVILTLLAVLIFATIVGTGGVFKVGDVFQKGFGMWTVILILVLLVVGVFVASGGTSIFPGIKISPTEIFGPIAGISTTTLALIIVIVGTGIIVWLVKGKKETEAR